MRKYILLISLLVLLASVVSFAQLDRSIQPQPGPPPSLQLPEIQRAKLDNGLNIIVVEHHELPIVKMQMVFKTGADADPMGKAGIASMTASMLD
jgi:zinc protease